MVPSRALCGAEVVWAARHEMARTVEDVLSRRTRWLQLDARTALAAAAQVAKLLAHELGRNQAWIAAQITEFSALAAGHLPEEPRPAVSAAESLVLPG